VVSCLKAVSVAGSCADGLSVLAANTEIATHRDCYITRKSILQMRFAIHVENFLCDRYDLVYSPRLGELLEIWDILTTFGKCSTCANLVDGVAAVTPSHCMQCRKELAETLYFKLVCNQVKWYESMTIDRLCLMSLPPCRSPGQLVIG
jgi:hypothetical protein